MKKILNETLNIATITLTILTLISYQFILPISAAHADEASTTDTSATTVDSSSSSGSDTTKTDDSKTDKTADNTTNSTDSADNSSKANDNTTTPPKADPPAAETTATDSSTDTADNTAATDATDTTAANPTVTAPTDTTNTTPSINSVSECTCKDKPDYEFLKEDCAKTYPDDCQCFIDYCKSISSTNLTQDSSNKAASDSVTGGNTIAGEPVTPTDPATSTDPTTPTDTTNTTDTSATTTTDSADKTDKTTDKTDTTSATIAAGDAVAQTTAINTVNTNIYTENGVQVTKTIAGDSAEDVNLLDTFNNILDSAKNLHAENGQALEHIVITNVNVAKDVENSATANADSGNNTIKNADGTASITSGNATAVASAVNLINTNIVGNTWLVGIINVVGNWSGNLIVPGAGLLKTPLADLIFDKIVNINEAKNVENSTSADANTGNNSISGSGGNSISSGNALSSASGINLVNTNIVRNNWFFLLINNAGNWTGSVINWDGDNGQENKIYEYDFGSLDDEAVQAKYASVYNYNSAENVNNTVIADANTGNNSISGSRGASILTGNAGAWASAINLVNTNIVGNNWMFGIVNNAGNWSGNVIFGYPDLDVSLTSDKKSIEPGEDLHYTITYKNIGQAKCDNVDLHLDLPSYLIYQSDTNGSESGSGNNYNWALSGLKPGEEKSFQVDVKLAKDVPTSITTLDSAAGATTKTKEVQLANNSASDSVSVIKSEVSIEDTVIQAQKDSDISISRKDDPVVAVGNITTHYIYVKNSGKYTLYNILATETIKDPSEKKAAEYSWSIPKLKKGQQAVINYQIFMGPQAQLGTYEFSASATGSNEYNYQVKSGKVKGKTDLIAGSGTAGSVSGANQELIPPAEASSGDLPQTVLGVETIKTSFPWWSLWILAVLASAYFIWKKELYRKRVIQRLARQMSGFLSSFLP